MKDFPLSRPAPAPLPGPLDEQFYDLVEARYRRVLRDNPTLATGHGIHAWDGQLGSGTREAVLEEIAQDRGHAAAVTALDAAGLSPEVRFERELELHHLRESLFHAEDRKSTRLNSSH